MNQYQYQLYKTEMVDLCLKSCDKKPVLIHPLDVEK